MVSLPQSIKLEIACPECGHKAYQSLVRLRRYKHFRCMGCGQTLLMRADGFAKRDAALAVFAKEAESVQFIIETVR